MPHPFPLLHLHLRIWQGEYVCVCVSLQNVSLGINSVYEYIPIHHWYWVLSCLLIVNQVVFFVLGWEDGLSMIWPKQDVIHQTKQPLEGATMTRSCFVVVVFYQQYGRGWLDLLTKWSDFHFRRAFLVRRRKFALNWNSMTHRKASKSIIFT